MASGGPVYHINMSFSFPATNPNNPDYPNWGGSLNLVVTEYNGSSLTLVDPDGDGDYDLPSSGNLLFYLFDVTSVAGSSPQSLAGSTSWFTGFGTTVNGQNLFLFNDTLPSTMDLYSVGPQASPGIGDGSSSYPCWVVGSSANSPWVAVLTQFNATTYPNGVTFPDVTFQFTVNPPSGQGWSQTTFGDDPDMIVTTGGG